MKKNCFLLLLITHFSVCQLYAQDTLPNFSLNNVGNNRIIVSWVNTLPDVKQISIQRSLDSLTGFKSILTVLDPTLPQNGYADVDPFNDHMFYRLYIQQDKGRYQFSETKKPVKDTAASIKKLVVDSLKLINPFLVKLNGFPGVDSTIVINPAIIKNKPTGFTTSLYVYTNPDGNVQIVLPDNEKPKKYSIKFFEEGGDFLFELKNLKVKSFKIDKANFFHAGWFSFELFEDGKLIEKYKFYLEKDF